MDLEKFWSDFKILWAAFVINIMILKPHSCLFFFFSLVNKQLNFLPQVWVGYQKNKLIVNISQASVQQNYDVGHTEIG